MKTIWIVESFCRSLENQTAQLYKLSGGIWPDELWVLGTADSDVASLPAGEVRLLLCPAAEREARLSALSSAVERFGGELLLFPTDGESAALATALASRLGGQSATGVQSCVPDPDGSLTVKRACYGGNMLAGLTLTRAPYCLSCGLSGGSVPAGVAVAAPRESQLVDFGLTSGADRLISVERNGAADELAAARRVVAIGMGVGSAANVPLFEKLADRLGARLGASRPVVMNGWVDTGSMLGVSGTMAAPELCLVFGASGSAAFMAGIENSKYIVAVNSDPQAPIMRMADLCVTADCVEMAEALLLELTENLPERNGTK